MDNVKRTATARILLLLTGIIALVAPVLFWGYLAGFKCAYNLSNSNCGISLNNFWDWEFLEISALPWAISLGCFIWARNIKSRN